MDFQELLQEAAAHISQSAGVESGSIVTALLNLLKGDDGELDLASLASSMVQNNLSDVVGSWLGSGENSAIDAEGIMALFGESKIGEFASALGFESSDAASLLSEVVPSIVDKATQGEGNIVDSLLEKAGGIEGAVGMLGKMFG